jgi:hypothetical protein
MLSVGGASNCRHVLLHLVALVSTHLHRVALLMGISWEVCTIRDEVLLSIPMSADNLTVLILID